MTTGDTLNSLSDSAAIYSSLNQADDQEIPSEQQNPSVPLTQRKQTHADNDNEHSKHYEQTTSQKSPAKAKPVVKALLKSQKAERLDPLTASRKAWCDTYFSALTLSGGDNSHTDLVLGVDINDKYIVSCSRDTTVKLWDAETGKFVRNYGGHTEAVNCARLVRTGSKEPNHVIISGGEDCKLKIWDTQSGSEFESLYLYNPVSCMTLVGDDSQYLAVGMSGGKLKLYHLQQLRQEGITMSAECTIDTDRITCLHCDRTHLAVGGSDGMVSVLDLSDDFTHMRCIYKLENHYFSGEPVTSVRICGAEILTSVRDQPNLSIVNWKRNTVVDIANHCSGFGVTDDVVFVCGGEDSDQDIILATGFDIDQGCGFINVRNTDTNKYDYLCSLFDQDVERILSMSAAYLPKYGKSGGDNAKLLNIVTGGRQLVLWRHDRSKSSDSIKATSLKLKLYNDRDNDDITSSDDEDHAPSTVNSSSSTTAKHSSLSSSHPDYRKPATAAYTLHSETGLRTGGKSNAAVWYLLFSVAVLVMPVLAWHLAQP